MAYAPILRAFVWKNMKTRLTFNSFPNYMFKSVVVVVVVMLVIKFVEKLYLLYSCKRRIYVCLLHMHLNFNAILDVIGSCCNKDLFQLNDFICNSIAVVLDNVRWIITNCFRYEMLFKLTIGRLRCTAMQAKGI